jgi:hypothetical protein
MSYQYRLLKRILIDTCLQEMVWRVRTVFIWHGTASDGGSCEDDNGPSGFHKNTEVIDRLVYVSFQK